MHWTVTNNTAEMKIMAIVQFGLKFFLASAERFMKPIKKERHDEKKRENAAVQIG